MPSAATGLTILNQSSGQVTLGWNPPVDIGAADVAFLDIATENGFVAYVVQDNLNPKNTSQKTYTLQPGTYWARVNTHFPGFGIPEFGPLDRGWFPSQHIPITVEPAPALPVGTPATNVVWTPGTHRLSWVRGSGNAAITRMSVDLSTFPNFNDILASPFVPVATCQGTLVGFPFAFDVPSTCNVLDILGVIVPDFYVRVNTLYGDRAWYPSEVKHIVNGVASGGGGEFPWALAAGAAGLVALYLYGNKGGLKPPAGA